jgi:uncharacterized peroxidase-related enzyme
MNQFKYHTPENSQGPAKEILTSVQQKYGFVPNLFAYMAEAPYTIEAYAMLTELLNKTALSAAQQQIALLAVSHYNQCEFCQVAHRAFGKMNQADPQTLQAINDDHVINDPSDKALVDMVVAIVDTRGWVKQTQLDAFLAAGFTRQNVYDLILIVTIKTLSNYANHLTKPEANEQLVAML